jgi:PKD repeat protein
VAILQADPLVGPAPLTVVFDGARSRDPDGFIIEYLWDFGDGAAASRAAVTHTYRRPGEFIALLTVKDNQNLQAQARRKISVERPSRGEPIALRRTTISVGSGPQALALGDFNGDDHPDLAVTNEDSHNVTIILSAGAGTGSLRARAEIAVPRRPLGIAVGDFNRDGDLDLALSSWVENIITIFVGDGRGNFSKERTISVCRQPKDLASADLNDDAHLDLAVLCSGAERVLVFFSDAQGNFGPGIPYAVGTRPLALHLLDFDNDAHIDIVVANDGTLSLLSNDGQGRFTARALEIPKEAFMLASADLNSDGLLDLAIVYENRASLTLLLSTDHDRYAQREFSLDTPARSVALGDLNGDGKADLAVGGQFNDLLVWCGDGLGEFADLQNFPVGGAPTRILIADLNNDTKLDLVTANANTASVTIFFNESPSASRLREVKE